LLLQGWRAALCKNASEEKLVIPHKSRGRFRQALRQALWRIAAAA
jgi:hypothetical protein